MRTFANVLWHVPFFGFLSAIGTWLFGGLLTLTVVAAPIGLGLMEFGKFLFAPFSRSMVRKSELRHQENHAWKAYSLLVSILYLPFGVLFAALGALQVAALFLTVIGIPAAIVVAKSLGTYLNPVNKRCVHHAVADEIVARRARAEVAHHLGGA